jgi:hypothetical protein
MFVTRHRLVVAAVVAAALVGVFVHDAEGRRFGDLGSGGDRGSGAVVASLPAGLAPVAMRTRTGADNEPGALVQSSRMRPAELALALVSGLMPAAMAWWCLSRPDRRLASPLARWSLAALRGPPTALLT